MQLTKNTITNNIIINMPNAKVPQRFGSSNWTPQEDELLRRMGGIKNANDPKLESMAIYLNRTTRSVYNRYRQL